jgi:hypothetical protein
MNPEAGKINYWWVRWVALIAISSVIPVASMAANYSDNIRVYRYKLTGLIPGELLVIEALRSLSMVIFFTVLGLAILMAWWQRAEMILYLVAASVVAVITFAYTLTVLRLIVIFLPKVYA